MSPEQAATWSSVVSVIIEHEGIFYGVTARRNMYLNLISLPFKCTFSQHLPIGLLYDLAQQPILVVQSSNEHADYFYDMVKMAECVRHGNIQRIMGLPQEEHSQLLESLRNDNAEQYWQIRQKLSGEQRIPIRLYKVSLLISKMGM